jgi:hypothetical protein
MALRPAGVVISLHGEAAKDVVAPIRTIVALEASTAAFNNIMSPSRQVTVSISGYSAVEMGMPDFTEGPPMLLELREIGDFLPRTLRPVNRD